MKCLKCGADNIETAKFCRNCGVELNYIKSTSYNVMYRFPAYDFFPTNFYDWRKPWLARFIKYFALVISFLLFITVIVCFLEHNWVEGNVVFVFVIFFISLFIFTKKGCKYPAKDNQLNKIADYVQQYHYTGLIKGWKKPILKFYVKDNKIGLLDVAHYSVFLAAQYDKLEWIEKNRYLNAIIGNREFIIDIYGEELK